MFLHQFIEDVASVVEDGHGGFHVVYGMDGLLTLILLSVLIATLRVNSIFFGQRDDLNRSITLRLLQESTHHLRIWSLLLHININRVVLTTLSQIFIFIGLNQGGFHSLEMDST